MKECSKCKQLKPKSDFNKRSSAHDGLQRRCRQCNSENLKKHYYDNRQYYIDKSRKNINDLKNKIAELKEKTPCSDCKMFYPSVCMDFDHIDSNKADNVSTLVGRGSAIKVWREIQKCEIVCSNCHRIRTAKRLSEVR